VGLVRRRAGRAGARRVAAAGSVAGALAALRGGPYGHAAAAATVAEAQRLVAGTVLWHLRVLAGWLPRDGVRTLRTLAAAFELANIAEHLRALTTDAPAAYFRMGALATAWPRLAETRTPDRLRAALAVSPWADPGDRPDIVRTLRYRYVAWLASVPAPAPAWAAAATALLVAGDRFAGGRVPPRRTVTALLGPAANDAASLPDLAAALPRAARWALADVATPDDLWRAEGRWWTRLDHDGRALLATAGLGPNAALGAAALLAADAWRVRAALTAASGGPTALTTYDLLVNDAPTTTRGAPDAA